MLSVFFNPFHKFINGKYRSINYKILNTFHICYKLTLFISLLHHLHLKSISLLGFSKKFIIIFN